MSRCRFRSSLPPRKRFARDVFFNVETPYEPVPHGNVAPVAPPLLRSHEAMPSTPLVQCFPGGETAPLTPRVGELEIFRALLIILSSFVTSKAQHICNSIRVARESCWHTLTSQRKLTKSDKESAVDTQSADPFRFDQCTGTRDTNFTTWSDSVPSNRSYVACSDPVCHALTRLLRTSEMNEEWSEHVHGKGNSPAL